MTLGFLHDNFADRTNSSDRNLAIATRKVAQLRLRSLDGR